MGCRCERCGAEWIPRDLSVEPTTCPKCKSAYWNKPKKGAVAPMLEYDDFKTRIEETLRNAGKDLTWTEIRTVAQLPQKWPNNQWVHRLEKDIGLQRKKDAHGIIHWRLT
jgi:hypothetical protein